MLVNSIVNYLNIFLRTFSPELRAIKHFIIEYNLSLTLNPMKKAEMKYSLMIVIDRST